MIQAQGKDVVTLSIIWMCILDKNWLIGVCLHAAQWQVMLHENASSLNICLCKLQEEEKEEEEEEGISV